MKSVSARTDALTENCLDRDSVCDEEIQRCIMDISLARSQIVDKADFSEVYNKTELDVIRDQLMRIS